MSERDPRVGARTVFHFGLSVRGALKWTSRDLGRLMKHPDGRRMTADEAREALMDQLAQGRLVIPVGPACDNWDYTEGCKGHRGDAATGRKE